MNAVNDQKHWWERWHPLAERWEDVDWDRVKEEILGDARRNGLGSFENHNRHLRDVQGISVLTPSALAYVYLLLSINCQKWGRSWDARYWAGECLGVCQDAVSSPTFDKVSLEAQSYLNLAKIESSLPKNSPEKVVKLLGKFEELTNKSGMDSFHSEKILLAGKWRKGTWLHRQSEGESKKALGQHGIQARELGDSDQIGNHFLALSYVAAMEQNAHDVEGNARNALYYYWQGRILHAYPHCLVQLGFAEYRLLESPSCYYHMLIGRWLAKELGLSHQTEGLGEALNLAERFCPEGVIFFARAYDALERGWPRLPPVERERDFSAQFATKQREIEYAWEEVCRFRASVETATGPNFEVVADELPKDVLHVWSGDSTGIPAKPACRSLNVRFCALHISDLQYGPRHVYKSNSRQTLLEQLQNALETIRDTESLVPDVVVVSGDIADKGLIAEYKDAAGFLRGLCDAVEWLTGGAFPNSNIILVPGNHDVTRWRCKGVRYEKKGYWQYPKKECEKGHVARLSNFKSFFDEFYGNKYTFDVDRGFNNYHIEKEGVKFCFTALNSCELETNVQHFGFVNCQNIELAAKSVTANVRIAAFHHNVRYDKLGESEQPDPRFLQNNQDVMEKLAENRYCLCLNGHVHAPDLRGPYGTRHGNVIPCGAGSIGVVSGERIRAEEVYPRSFNLLCFEVNPLGASVHVQVWNFVPSSPGVPYRWQKYSTKHYLDLASVWE